jgi:fumarate reductase subunit D
VRAPAKRSPEPLLWLLFSAGGMLAALLLPALAARLWLAPAAGLAEPLGFEAARALAAPAAVRVALFLVLALALFHWAHRFRFTLYDGLQLAHLWGLIATVCYGGAALGTLFAGWVLWRLP